MMRKLPGALGNASSAAEDSYSQVLEGMPEYPHYTRPPVHRGWQVPEVLLSGDHGKVREWRLERSRERAKAFAEHERAATKFGPGSSSDTE
jgi:tRNA (guanine37-N1)-methyltransferase